MQKSIYRSKHAQETDKEPCIIVAQVPYRLTSIELIIEQVNRRNLFGNCAMQIYRRERQQWRNRYLNFFYFVFYP